MSRFLYMQCLSSNIAYPHWAKRWVNIRKVFCNAYHVQRTGLSTMLEILGLAFEGHQHSGIDDARNIARVLAQLINDGCNVYENERLVLSSPTASDDSQAAEVAVLQPDESKSIDNNASSSEVCVSEEKTVPDNNFDDPNSDQVPAEQVAEDVVKCTDLLEHFSL